MHPRSLLPGILSLVSSVTGATFAAISTQDYAKHLDRQLHGTHCSFIPGAGAATAENACSTAMYSPYSAMFRDKLWGGVPISLFGLGSFCFFAAAGVYLLLARENASKRMRLGFFLATLGPLLASITMLVISLTKLEAVCKLCSGIYVSSLVLFASGVLALVGSRKTFGYVGPAAPAPPPPRSADPEATQLDPEPWHKSDGPKPPNVKNSVTLPSGATMNAPIEPPTGSILALFGLLALLALATAMPALVYAGTVPSYKEHIVGCGKLLNVTDKKGALVKMPTTSPVQKAITFEDPLCPTCKAFHDRLVTEGIYDKLDISVAVFPLDSECNFLLSRPLHPGACVLARAVLCGDKDGTARNVLEWSYKNQEKLREAGKRDPAEVRKEVVTKFPAMDECIDSTETKKRLENVLQFAIENKVRVSTPQLYLDDNRVCDEDTDLGLRYTLAQLAPKVKP